MDKKAAMAKADPRNVPDGQVMNERLFLNIHDGAMKVSRRGQHPNEGEVVKSLEDIAMLIIKYEADETVSCSSSLDFPEEYTNDPAVIALANEIREA